MPNGTVKFFNPSKGFGFITPDGGAKDIFVAAAAVTAAQLPGFKAGQRVSFEAMPDTKGPKAVNVVILADLRPQQSADRSVRPTKTEEKSRITLYHDPDSDRSCDALEELRAAGYEPQVIDYHATPLTIDELKRLSLLLRDGDQSLVRKYDPLFLELRLDDRFISENEFWTAIVEHPSLINGPIVAIAGRATVCRSEDALARFLAAAAHGGVPVPAKPKDLPKRILDLVAPDGARRPAAEQQAANGSNDNPIERKSDIPVPRADTNIEAEAEAKPKAKTKAATKAKPETKPVRKAAPVTKTLAKSKTSATKTAKKPAKSVRTAKKS